MAADWGGRLSLLRRCQDDGAVTGTVFSGALALLGAGSVFMTDVPPKKLVPSKKWANPLLSHFASSSNPWKVVLNAFQREASESGIQPNATSKASLLL